MTDAPQTFSSNDPTPWDHPYLTAANLQAFRRYSDQVNAFALDYMARRPEPLDAVFSVNMAQTMYKWATMTRARGWQSDLILHPLDTSALSRPEWEEYDGAFGDLMDGERFLQENPDIPLRVPVRRVRAEGSAFYVASQQFGQGHREPLLSMLAQTPALRDEEMMKYPGYYGYHEWARTIAEYSVACSTSFPIPAYFSGVPYVVSSVGGDLQVDAGRSGDLGKLTVRAFNAARFLMISNPHSVGHCRRLDLTNGLFVPYPLDTDHYKPGPGKARREWDERFGEGVYILTTARLDSEVKGHSRAFFEVIVDACRRNPNLRFIFLKWGLGADIFSNHVKAAGLVDQIILLPPVGKARLMDYYRSCDVLLDQFVYGYYGCTALEAAAVAKPVIMKLRSEHYTPLYGESAPVFNADYPAQVSEALDRLAADPQLRQASGDAMRAWVVRAHGEHTATPRLMALMRLTADGVKLPKDLESPLFAPKSEAERAYHASRLTPDP
jgi:glycosyltransferase involved in cell wall biosynthesis